MIFPCCILNISWMKLYCTVRTKAFSIQFETCIIYKNTPQTIKLLSNYSFTTVNVEYVQNLTDKVYFEFFLLNIHFFLKCYVFHVKLKLIEFVLAKYYIILYYMATFSFEIKALCWNLHITTVIFSLKLVEQHVSAVFFILFVSYLSNFHLWISTLSYNILIFWIIKISHNVVTFFSIKLNYFHHFIQYMHILLSVSQMLCWGVKLPLTTRDWNSFLFCCLQSPSLHPPHHAYRQTISTRYISSEFKCNQSRRHHHFHHLRLH